MLPGLVELLACLWMLLVHVPAEPVLVFSASLLVWCMMLSRD